MPTNPGPVSILSRCVARLQRSREENGVKSQETERSETSFSFGFSAEFV